MSETVGTEEDLKYAVRIARRILIVIGAWPFPRGASYFEKILQKFLNAVCIFLLLFIIVPGILRVVLKEKDPNVKVLIIAPLITASLNLIKYMLLLYRSAEIREALEEMRKDWISIKSSEYREIMLSKAKIGRRLVVLSVTFMFGGGLPFRTIVPLSKGSALNADNVTIRFLACPNYFIVFDAQIPPVYWIVFTLQLFAGILAYCTISGACGLSAFLVMHICGQLRILMDKMKAIVEGTDVDADVATTRISEFIEMHIKLLKFLKHVEKIIEYICLVEVVGGTILLCMTGYSTLLEWKNHHTTATLTYILIELSFSFSIFIFCYISQLLDNESTDLGLTSRTIDWYHLTPKKARCLIIIIITSTNPLKITAARMMDLSLNSFVSIMKTAIGYINILRAVM